MKSRLLHSLFRTTIVFGSFLVASCSNTKYLTDGEVLFTGYKVNSIREEPRISTKTAANDVEEILKPLPNKKFLGLRIKLWLYNVSKDTTGSGKFKKWFNTKLGEPPVLLSDVDEKLNEKRANVSLFNNGYFDSYSKYITEGNGKRAKIRYDLHLYRPYTFGAVTLGIPDVVMASWITKSLDETLIKPGDRYTLETIRAEKDRITDFLKNKGYYYIKADDLRYEADSSGNGKAVALKLVLNTANPGRITERFAIGDVYINKAYSVKSDTGTFQPVVFNADTFRVKSSAYPMRDAPILRSVLLRPGEIYTLRNHNGTLGQLMSMGTFKFVNLKFTEDSARTDSSLLNAYIDLTLLPKRTLSAELDVVSKSSNYFGPGLNFYLRNRNIFNGAELLIYNMSFSFETQLTGAFKTLNSFEIGPNVELVFPKFLVPFKVGRYSSFYVPTTHLVIGYSFLSRKDYFDLTSFSFSYGFKWKETLLKSHELIPVSINYVRVSNKSESFQEMLDDNPLLQKSFEEQFLAGLKYYFSYNELLDLTRKNKVYYQARFESSGNLLSLAHGLTSGSKADPEEPYKIAGEVYAQFVKAESDFRHYLIFGNDHKFVSRIYGGIGIPYGNSETLPYISQFFSGGSSGIRAFPARSLGPGSWAEQADNESFYDQGGDIKLEWNEELRLSLTKLLKFAVFMDCGNIWLLRENEAIPGGKFESDFYKELAVGTGIGFRLDAGFFVLRLDMGIPLRKPWLPDGERWVIDKIKFGSSSWRSDNMVFNLAIGYPF